MTFTLQCFDVAENSRPVDIGVSAVFNGQGMKH
jgi:hypothetical protein